MWTSGRKRQELDSKTRRFHIFENYVTSGIELKQRAEKLEEEKQVIVADHLEWKEKHKNREIETKKLFEEMKKELEKRMMS